MTTTEELNATFQKVGNDFGFGNVTAEYAPFRDLKVRWQRTYDWASFQVSDYLEGAPIEVVEGIARTIMERIRGTDGDYSEETSQWLTSHEFRAQNQQTYIQRSRMIAVPVDGDDRLRESYERLMENGLIDEIEDLKMYWSKAEGSTKMGESSCLMRVVIMNPKLSEDDVPEDVLDYCLLHELANIKVGFTTDRETRTEEISNIMDSCPEALKAQSWLEDNRLEA